MKPVGQDLTDLMMAKPVLLTPATWKSSWNRGLMDDWEFSK